MKKNNLIALDFDGDDACLEFELCNLERIIMQFLESLGSQFDEKWRAHGYLE